MTDASGALLVPPLPKATGVRNERRAAIGLALPALLVLIFLFVVPLALLLSQSLEGDDGLSLNAYVRLLGDSYGLHLVWNSFRLALLTTGITLAVGYPAAFGLALTKGALRSILLASLFLPLAVSVIAKAFAWTILLRSHGVVNDTLMALNIISHPIRMIFTPTALIVGAVNIFIPFMILPIFTVVAQIDPRLSEAAATLGASPVVVFLRVVMPLSIPGVVAGVALVFSLSVSAYVVPNLLMGENYPTLASTIAKAFLLARDPALGAAAGVILMSIGLVVVVGSNLVGRPHRKPSS